MTRTLDSKGVVKTTPDVPAGLIVAFQGSAIPAGWALCDGTLGTPDLRDRFIIGAAAVGLGTAQGTISPTAGLTHSGAAIGNHSAHVVTQPSAHANHVVTQAAQHSNHVVTQAGAHANHAANATHQHDAHVTSASLAGTTTVIAPSTHAANASHTHDAHSAHTGAAASPHSPYTPDSGPNNLVGILQGTNPATAVAGQFANALLFDGVDLDTLTSGVDCGATSTGISSGAFTVECWFKLTVAAAVADAGLVVRWGATTASENYALYLGGGTGKVAGVVTNSVPAGVAIVSTTTPADTLWHHAALVWDGATTLSLYYDGNRLGTAGLTALQAADATTHLWLARFDDTVTAGAGPYGFPGSIDEVRISTTARYSGATYVVPVAAFTSDASTKLLYHLDSIVGHTGANLDAHSAHSGMTVDAHSAHAVTQPATHAVPLQYSLAYLMRTI